MKPCVVPDAALRDQESVEMIRVWIAEQGLHCALNIGMYQDQGKTEQVAWGIILADVVRHVSDALKQRYGLDAGDSLAQILDTFLTELGAPTSRATGGFSSSGH